MREAEFKRYWQLAIVPCLGVAPVEDGDEVDTKSPMYKAMLSLIDSCIATWQRASIPGDYLVADESMIFWQGTGEVHITFQPRKPTSYGIELKSLACGEAHIILNVELVEGREVDSTK